jgi:copper chaperone
MIQINVAGMSCQHCVKSVTAALTAVDPLATVSIDLPAGKVSVDSTAPVGRLTDAISDAGYEVIATTGQ